VLAGVIFVAISMVAVGVWLRGWGHYDYVFPGGGESGDYVMPARAIFTMALVGANLGLTALVAR
jgi:hypothetical protein